jgi:hypothetical protein
MLRKKLILEVLLFCLLSTGFVANAMYIVDHAKMTDKSAVLLTPHTN